MSMNSNLSYIKFLRKSGIKFFLQDIPKKFYEENKLSTNQNLSENIENINNLKDWKDITELVPKKFTKTKKLKKTGLAGLFSASLELTREGLISILQKKNFDKLMIKAKK